jgi:hypothetical protein
MAFHWALIKKILIIISKNDRLEQTNHTGWSPLNDFKLLFTNLASSV